MAADQDSPITSESEAPLAEGGQRGLALLCCPHCGGRLYEPASSELSCSNCRTPVVVHDGIIDFVAGSAATKLDDIDYDAFYAINDDYAVQLYRMLRMAAGPLWPTDIGDAVEIGCGTGGFSMAVLSQMRTSRLVLTDISVKMLALCRDRLRRMDAQRAADVVFATYGGTEPCFRPDAFDTCFGTAVVHHIIDVPRFLGQVHRLLKPGGKAFFMEPNRRFHAALTATLADLVAKWSREGLVADADISRMVNWMAVIHCSIANSGDIEVLSGVEDKHYFLAEEFEAMAAAADFGLAAALPCRPDPTGLETIENYLTQCQVTPPTIDLLRQAWPAVQPNRFIGLASRDQSASYLFWMQKRPGRPRASAAGRQGDTEAKARVETNRKLRLLLGLQLVRGAENWEIVASGWCAGIEPVRAIQLTLKDLRRRIPIWRPRHDVLDLVEPAVPPLHAFCSGIDERVALRGIEVGEAPIQVVVDVVAADGCLLRGRSVRLHPDGEARLIDLIELPIAS